jgi:hypothetical protein
MGRVVATSTVVAGGPTPPHAVSCLAPRTYATVTAPRHHAARAARHHGPAPPWLPRVAQRRAWREREGLERGRPWRSKRGRLERETGGREASKERDQREGAAPRNGFVFRLYTRHWVLGLGMVAGWARISEAGLIK